MAKNQTKKPAQDNPKTDSISRSEVEQIVGELTADLQRLQAEFINYKRRAEEEKLQSIQLGKQQALSTLLPVLDNIERAIAHAPEDINDHPWVKGVVSVAKQLEDQLKNIGLVKIGAVGDKFDPEMFEAIAVEDGDGQEEVISDILQTGYALDGRIIRHAMVKVKRK